MARKVKNTKDLTRGFKGWEKQYIKKSIAYGHLEDGTGSTTRQEDKRGNR